MGKLTKDEYITIKQLFKRGYQGQEIAKIVKRGTGTVSAVKNTFDYTDYRRRLEKSYIENKKRTAELINTVVPYQLKLTEPKRISKLGRLKELLTKYKRTKGLREAADVCEYLDNQLEKGGKNDTSGSNAKNA